MEASEIDKSAGIAVGRRVIPAHLIDYSLNGCGLGLEEKLKLSIGDQIRLATSKGQYWGVVRRIIDDNPDFVQTVGIKFVEGIDEEFKQKNSLHLMSANGKHAVGGNFSVAVVVGVLSAWAIVAYVLFLIFAK